ncbi:hypothetical protein T484DRAFT_1954712 [Baffinella frigidus]|nr:hypothetical protein T484DRAFT_1954712 [Cryptophyta sp. CCMP2293]|mmetsp:Transcript_36429/g.85217  ORF Transcript_36429/g.85217 Transcript_36429/m.85217 type:complete len:227 (-) Transcript_36429:38-718(-)
MQSAVPFAPEGTTHLGARVAGHNEHWTAAEVERLPCPTWLRTGDMVWLSTRDAHIARRGTFTPAYMGPFAVTLVDEAQETCRLILPAHSNILDEPFHLYQLRLHCTQADEVTLCVLDLAISSGDYVQHEAFSNDSKTAPSQLERCKNAEDSEEISNAFSVLQILNLPRPQRIATATAPASNTWEEPRQSIRDPDQQVLASFMAKMDVDSGDRQGSASTPCRYSARA